MTAFPVKWTSVIYEFCELSPRKVQTEIWHLSVQSSRASWHLFSSPYVRETWNWQWKRQGYSVFSLLGFPRLMPNLCSKQSNFSFRDSNILSDSAFIKRIGAKAQHLFKGMKLGAGRI